MSDKHVCGPKCKMTPLKWVKVYAYIIQRNVRDFVAGMLQDLAEWIAP